MYHSKINIPWSFLFKALNLCFQYDNKEDDPSRCSNESEEDDEEEIPAEGLLNKPEKGKKGRGG